MAARTKNEIMEQVENAISCLAGPDGSSAIAVLLANRQAIIILHGLAEELALGAYERSKQERRKERRATVSVPGQDPLWDLQ